MVSKNTLSISGLLGNSIGALKFQELKSEILRKAIHILIALSPSMAAVNRPLTMILLMAGTLCYTYLETLRGAGVKIPLFSSIASMASRSRDKGRFVLGPVTLGIGALLALLWYPSPVASIGIYALAFGDGFASLIGKLFGRIRPSCLGGKSVEGSLACFIAVLLAAYQVSYNYKTALIAALTATLIEALPLKDYDNLAIPIGVGFAAGLTLYY
jgi:dolichol kinase